MTPEADRGIDPDTLEPGRTYRVDHQNEFLRRSFRLTGSFVGRDVRALEKRAEPVEVLLFEVKPRFGKPGEQAVEVSTITFISEF